MTDPIPADKPKRLTREEVALIEVGHTGIGRGTAWTMVLAFLFLIAVVPIADAYAQWRHDRLAGIRVLDIVRDPPRIDAFTFPVHRQAVAERNPLHDYEHSVEDASLARVSFQPHLQERLTGWLHTGNSKVVLGSGDWLFYRPGIDYLTYPGFLEGSQHQILRRLHPDPRPAILRFHQDCQAAGVRLVLLPIADKAQIHPEKLTGRNPGVAIENPDYQRWLDGLRAAGVEVVTTTDLIRELAAKGPAYLRQDTHWTPETMDAVAAAVARALALAPAAQPRVWKAKALEVSRIGDLVDTLKMPPGQTLYAPQGVRITQVSDAASGAPWASVREAEVLLLGDSFSNIYTASQMGWGSAAGFAPHLALHLGRDLDVIAINGSGASGTRRNLAQRPAPLAGKRVVLWQFSVRDLGVSDWEVIPVDKAGSDEPAVAQSALELDVELVAVSQVAQPGTTPYSEALTTLKAKVVGVHGGTLVDTQILLIVPCMAKFALLPAARLAVGDAIHVKVRPWSDVEAEQETVRRFDDTNEYDLPLWWIDGWTGH